MPNPVETDILDGHFIHREGSPLPQLETKGGARLAQPETKKSPLKKVGFALYIILVILSAIIVGTYLIWNLLVKPPEISNDPPAASSIQAPEIPADTSTTDASTPPEDTSTPTEPVPTRRDGVYTFALLGSDKASGNTDTIIVVTYDTVKQTVGMVSIPRDTAVNRSWAKYPKINHAYSQGPDVLKQEIENTFGIPIDYYIHINLSGFITLVNKLGGVDVYIPEDMNYDDPYQDLHIHYTKGQWHLNGQQAMEVARFRDNNDGTGYTDEGRAAMQRQMLVNLAKKVLSWNSLTKVLDFVDIFNTYVKTDLSVTDMAWFATQAINVDLSTGLKQGSLEGRSDSYYKGHSWCYTYKAEDILPTLNEILNPYDMDLTAEDLDLPKASGYYFKY